MKQHLLFILIISVFTTLVKYEFAHSDQLAQIPLILNEINPDYLTHDFFVGVNETYGPRFYYSKFMAMGSQLMTLPIWFLLLSILCGLLTAWLTYLTVTQLFFDRTKALLAAVFVLVLPTPTLAESTFNVYENVMTPSALVLPMLIGALYYFFKNQQLIIPMILVGVASLFQVLYGLTTGLLILFAYCCSIVLFKQSNKIFYSFKKFLIGFLMLTLFVSASMIPYYMTAISEKMTTHEFLEIIAFRGAHHYIPSTFPWRAWIFSIAFFGAAFLAAMATKRRRKEQEEHGLKTAIGERFYWQSGVMAGAILFGFLLGYVFVEILPIRLVITAQTFRYVILLKWLACIYLAIGLPANLRLSVVLHPMSLWIDQILTYFKVEKRLKHYEVFATILTIILVILVPLREQILLLVAIFVISLFVFYEKFHNITFFKILWTKRKTLIGMTILTIGLAISPFISQRFLPNKIDNILSKVYPKYDYKYRYNKDLKELSTTIKEATSEKSTLIVPPDLSAIRFSADRAIVVDFKAIPFQDQALLAFRQRLKDCYGDTDKLGFEALEAMKKQYLNISYEKLQDLKTQYNADFAVVDAENKIHQNIIFENESYKLVKIDFGAKSISK